MKKRKPKTVAFILHIIRFNKTFFGTRRTSLSCDMEIRFLGTGGAFDPEFGNSSALVMCNGKTFLIDCGFTVYPVLKKYNLFSRIDYVLLTHLHNDHTGSLVNTVLHFNLISHPGQKLKIVFPTKKFRKQTKRLMDIALMNTDNFVDWIPMEEMKEVSVIDTHSRHVNEYQTWGYIFREGEEAVVYSGDIEDGDFIFKKMMKKKIDRATVFHELVFSEVPGHTHYTTLSKHLSEFRIYGYHCDPRNSPADNAVPLVANHPEFLLH
jgi:ribonuclease BN (tRNA processing enzyme)